MERPITIFYVYAETDDALRQELDKHLAPLRRQGMIAGWEPVLAGESWAEKTELALHAASLILLLISADFLASESCYKQMQRVLALQQCGEVEAISILLRPADRADAQFAHLPALPSNGKPITSWPNRDEAFEAVAEGIRRMVKEAMLLKMQSLEDNTDNIVLLPPKRADRLFTRPPYKRVFLAIAILVAIALFFSSVLRPLQNPPIVKQPMPIPTIGTIVPPTATLISTLTPLHTITPSPTSTPPPTATPSPTPTPLLKIIPSPLVPGPKFTISSTSVNANTDCQYDVNNGWVCPLSLSNSQNAQQTLSWIASSSSTDVVGFSPQSGVASPGQTISIKVLVNNIGCPRTLTLTFSGPENKVTVPWHCGAPTLTANITDLTNGIGCTFTNNPYNVYSCPEDLSISGGSQGSLNWSSSGSESICGVSGCSTGPLSSGTITPSQGSIISSATYEPITIIVPFCQHESIKDTIIFSGPANSVTVTYTCNSST